VASSKTAELLADTRKAHQARDQAKMREILKRAIATDPNNVEVWLLGTYATDNVEQRRRFIAQAKQINPTDTRISKREKELFPDTEGATTFDSNQARTPGLTQPQARVAPSQPLNAPAKPQSGVTTAVPATPGGVRLKRPPRRAALALVLIGIVILIGIIALIHHGYSLDTPDAVVLRLYPALQTGYNATLAIVFTEYVKALCGDDLVSCIQIPAQQLENFSIARESLSGQTATVKLRFQT